MTAELDTYRCADCGRVFNRQAGLTRHQGQAHTTRPTKAAKAATNGDTDHFARIGNATRALFPGGVPEERIIEIAELQRTMLKVLLRT